MAKETYYVSVKQEGAAGATRGKLSSAACQALGAEDGDVIEIVVKGQRIVGGGILSSREAKDYHKEHSRDARKPAKKIVGKKRKSRDDDDSSEAPRKSKKAAKPKVKSKKRKTSVDYDSSRPKKAKKGKKGKFKLGKR